MTKFELNQVDVRGDGRVILYQRPRSDGSIIPTWQMRISVPNSKGYHRQTTGEKDQDEASRKALNKYDELAVKVLSGQSLTGTTFNNAYQIWKKDFPKLETTRTQRYIDDRIKGVGSYPLDFFSNKKLDTISRGDFNDYWIWRRENSTLTNPSSKKSKSYVPSNNTLRKDAAFLKVFFKYCVDKGWLRGVPIMNEPSHDKSRRPSFTLTEWRKLTRLMREWVKEGQSWGGVGRDRLLIQNYVLLLANCGARIGEFRFLAYHDFSTVQADDGPRLVAVVDGKTGKRQIVFQKGSEEYLKRIYDLRKQELNNDPPLDSYVFCHKDGKPIGSMKKGFESLLDFTGLRQDAQKRNRTLYSLRHFYATMRLSEEVSPYLLAQQMGTSVEMLERFYGHVVTALIAEQVTKTTSRQKVESDISDNYPFMR